MFMYCSSLTHFFFNLKDFSIAKLWSNCDKIIIAVSWNPKLQDLIASVDNNSTLHIWNIKDE